MSGETSGQLGARLFSEGNYAQALRVFAQALGEEETSERWNDWAATQVVLNQLGEAEQGFRRACELDPSHAQATVNLGVLLMRLQRYKEALTLLEQGMAGLEESQRSTCFSLMEECRARLTGNQDSDRSEMEAYLRRFVGSDENGQSYFNTHLQRYIATLEMLPAGSPGQRLLELGAAFHHLTPALRRWKNYRGVRCNDIWDGEAQCRRRVVSRDGREDFVFTVDNFDVQLAPWPYADEYFDVVLCCEMLEHLLSDPMQVMSEINRILKPGGLLLLTTPNVASAKGAAFLLQGRSPYIYGQFEPGGRPTDRHNREYTPEEVEHLAWAAGFGVVELRTQDFYWSSARAVLRYLAAAGFSVVRRGDTILLLARKDETVRERYPGAFYALIGNQAERRTQQAVAAATGLSVEGKPVGTPQRVLLVHEILPEYDRSGCDQRLMQVLRGLRSQGHEVTYIARHGTNRERYLPPLREMGITVYAHDAERLRALGLDAPAEWTLEQVLTEEQYDLAILYHWYWVVNSVPEQYLKDIRRLSPETRIAVLTDDRHGLRELRLAELSGTLWDRERAHDYQQRELEVYRQADLVLTVSEEDRQGLLAAAPELITEILPNDAESLVENEGASNPPSYEEREGLLFLGNYDNLANRDGILWFLEEVWPLLRPKLPGVLLYLVGNNLPADFAADYEGVVRVGYVNELGEAFARYRVCVSPARYGTGTKTKNLNAMSHGLPVVTTTIGAEGLRLTHGTNALIADTAEEFAGAIERLYGDKVLWQKLTEEGCIHITRHFSRERLDGQIARILELAHQISPRRDGGMHPFSFSLVEKKYPGILEHQPPYDRIKLRLQAYLQLAEYLLASGQPAAAREQLRHIFSYIRGNPPRDAFLARVLAALERCYLELGDDELAKECWHGAQLCIPAPDSSPQPGSESAPGRFRNTRKRHTQRNRPSLSVIIPTYNRSETLLSCLAALNRQTILPEQFEVLVIDDGSTDRTEERCRSFDSPYRLRHLRQANAGPGAARRLGVEEACGEYLLLFNDDTMASPDLLAEHVRVHHSSSARKLAVLGDFRYPADARRRALTFFFSTHPFLFPQVNLDAGEHCENAYFITCNLSVSRQAVLSVGSFDPRFRVAEDTELGVRLRKAGYKVLYDPLALAWHDHLQFTTADLIRRARAYGEADALLLRKHPQLLGDGSKPFGRMDTQSVAKLAARVESLRANAPETVRALEGFDDVDFRALLDQRVGETTAADEVMKLFEHAVPTIFWFYLLERFLEVWSPVAEPTAGDAGIACRQEYEANIECQP